MSSSVPLTAAQTPENQAQPYQVLARKWRPRNFETLVGQEHVVRALTHALDQQRLHHAWLFTGTRGVGKTTLSRILAKSLNCIGVDGNGGITSKPCGDCPVCQAIDAGRFVDYIEMDAASNRGVDEMAQLLEQAVYAPSNARFKVYMIDEVHMLTNHAFNAMLKTLEEPPAHVKFILATTDPQKIPVTVLSRCLQFNLKQMPLQQIIGHLDFVLQQEAIASEPQALRLLARAAQGSMRDALSLTDQAIAYSAGTISEEAVRGMLGALDANYLIRILDALVERDGPALIAVADDIAARSLSYGSALQDLASLLHRIALAQSVPAAITDDQADAAPVRRLATLFNAEEVQLQYQIATLGRSDLSLAPDEYAGFTMTLLRMLAFRPIEVGAVRPQSTVPNQHAPQARSSQAGSPAASRLVAEGSTAPISLSPVKQALAAARQVPPQARATCSVNPGATKPIEARNAQPIAAATTTTSTASFDGDWLALAASLKVSGMTRQMVQQAELVAYDNDAIQLRVPSQGLLAAGTLDKLKAAITEHFGRALRITAEVGTVQGHTVAAVEHGARSARQAHAVAAIEADPFVQTLVKDFGAAVIPGSIRPI